MGKGRDRYQRLESGIAVSISGQKRVKYREPGEKKSSGSFLETGKEGNTVMGEKRILGQPDKREGILTALYLLIFLIVASSIALAQPLYDTPPVYANAPDEHARYLIPKYICEHGTLPTAYDEEVRIPGYGSSYALYGILPYIFMGMLMRFVNLFTDSELYLLYSARFVNVLFGTLMAFAVRKLAVRIFDDEAKKIGLDWLFCFLVTFMPQSLFLHTYVNTDSLAMLSTALILYALVCIYQDGFGVFNSGVLCVGVISCALSYYNAYGYIVSAVLLCLAYFVKTVPKKLQQETGHRKSGISYDWKNMLRHAAPITAVILLGTAWWYIRSYILYDGDILGFHTADKMMELYAVDKVNPLTSQTYQQMGYTLWKMMRETDYLTIAYASFVGAYGSLSIFANIWIYRFYKLFFYGGLLGYLVTIPFYRHRHEGKRLFFHTNLVFCMVMPVLLTLYYAYTSDFQAQGRYMMPMLLPLMIYVVKGLERLAALGKNMLQRRADNHVRTERCAALERILGIAVMFAMAGIVLMLFWMVYGIAMPIYGQFLTVGR